MPKYINAKHTLYVMWVLYCSEMPSKILVYVSMNSDGRINAEREFIGTRVCSSVSLLRSFWRLADRGCGTELQY